MDQTKRAGEKKLEGETSAVSQISLHFLLVGT